MHKQQSNKAIMDPIIFENTEKYAKTLVLKKVVQNPTHIKEKVIYVADPPPQNQDTWKAVLIDSQTQAGKTRKCFEILSQKISATPGNTLVLFITQANNTASVNQILQRAPASPDIKSIIPSTNIFRSSSTPENITQDGNYMVVDFWNSKNMDNMLEFVKDTSDTWQNITIVIDEVEQAGLRGVKERLTFIRKVEKAATPDVFVNVIFVTATTANLSKCILRVAKDNQMQFEDSVVADIVSKAVVEHHYATPHATYVGASWFKNTPEVWKRLIFPKREATTTKDEYTRQKLRMVLQEVKQLPDPAKELSLIVTSTRTDDHSRLAERLYRIGYNVTVELNGKLNKNYKVNYIDKSGEISTWIIPYAQIDAQADRGNLETYRNARKKTVHSGILVKEDYTLSHILQAALFMMTDAEERIKTHTSAEEFAKLEAISNAISNLDKSLRRPEDYPDKPRVAMVAGHLAGRGITIQNAAIDFTCTSFCFTETRDTAQRGATNTQRFGRACGMLGDVFARPGRQPILIATDGIIKDAVANEMAVIEKAHEFPNGTLISLKDLVTQADWERILTHVKKDMKRKQQRDTTNSQIVDGVNIADLKRYYKSKNLLIGKMIRYLHQQSGPITFAQFKEGINYTKSDKQFQSNIKNGICSASCYGKLWSFENNTIILNPNIQAYVK